MANLSDFQFADHNSSFEDIKSYHDEVKALICKKYDKTRNDNYVVDFAGMTDDEILEQQKCLLNELSLEGALTLLTLVESYFRRDCVCRCLNGLTDPLSVELQSKVAAVSRLHQLSFKDDILKGWETYLYPTEHDFFARIGQNMDFRNWVAHGRYWAFKDNLRKYDFDSVYTVCELIMKKFAGDFVLTSVGDLAAE